MISHELKKMYTSVLVGVMFNKIRTSSAWSSPRKTYGRSQQYPPEPPKLRPERRRRKGSPPSWNPQMSVRQGTWFNLSLGAFSQSSAERETEDSGAVRCAVRAEPMHSLSRRGQSPVSYRCSRIKHTCFLLSKLKSDPDMDRNWEFSFSSTAPLEFSSCQGYYYLPSYLSAADF